MDNDEIAQFIHKKTLVYTRESLMGYHREYCLCHICNKLNPNAPGNCSIAQKLYEFDVKHNVTTPVFYCKKYEKKS